MNVNNFKFIFFKISRPDCQNSRIPEFKKKKKKKLIEKKRKKEKGKMYNNNSNVASAGGEITTQKRKFYETTFLEYTEAAKKRVNLHAKVTSLYETHFPKTLSAMRNLIFYGPCGSGKYTQSLLAIQKYSPSNLKYEKKLVIQMDDKQYSMKISDVHYEIDMSLLGCNPKLTWHEIYSQIIDIICAKQEKVGIILCKNFHEIHSELLDNFYSYMQNISHHYIHVTFLLLTEEFGFIPENIVERCGLIHVEAIQSVEVMAESFLARKRKEAIGIPTRTTEEKEKIKKEVGDIHAAYPTENLKFVYSVFAESKKGQDQGQGQGEDQEQENKCDEQSISTLMHKICDKIVDNISSTGNPDLNQIRENLYDLLTFNLNIYHCVWYIIQKVFSKYETKLSVRDTSEILIQTYNFLKYYNNNYRPIYHLENYVVTLIIQLKKK